MAPASVCCLLVCPARLPPHGGGSGETGHRACPRPLQTPSRREQTEMRFKRKGCPGIWDPVGGWGHRSGLTADTAAINRGFKESSQLGEACCCPVEVRTGDHRKVWRRPLGSQATASHEVLLFVVYVVFCEQVYVCMTSQTCWQIDGKYEPAPLSSVRMRECVCFTVFCTRYAQKKCAATYASEQQQFFLEPAPNHIACIPAVR